MKFVLINSEIPPGVSIPPCFDRGPFSPATLPVIRALWLYALAHYNKGVMIASEQPQEAIAQVKVALEIVPDFIAAKNFLLKQGRILKP